MKKSDNKSLDNQLPEHYTSIDYMPIMNWSKAHEKKDVAYLLCKHQTITEAQRQQLNAVWQAMYEEFVSIFGLGDSYKDMLEQRLKIGKLKLKLIITGDETLRNFIRAHEKKLEIMKSNNGSSDIYKTKQAIESHPKYRGIRISLTETSVREFYSYLQDLKTSK